MKNITLKETNILEELQNYCKSNKDIAMQMVSDRKVLLQYYNGYSYINCAIFYTDLCGTSSITVLKDLPDDFNIPEYFKTVDTNIFLNQESLKTFPKLSKININYLMLFNRRISKSDRIFDCNIQTLCLSSNWGFRELGKNAGIIDDNIKLYSNICSTKIIWV